MSVQDPAADRSLLDLIRRRVTASRFDPDRAVDERTIRELVADATTAPSSFNLQHWRFLAVRDRAARSRLQEAAYGQEQVGAAPVTFVLLGDTRAVEHLPSILDTAVARGAMAEGKAAAWVRMANRIYADHRMARDEAIRSASLAAMTLMLAAEARGLASGALSGFDPERVRREFGIGERYLPVLLLTVGHPVEPRGPRMPRFGVDDVLRLDDWRE